MFRVSLIENAATTLSPGAAGNRTSKQNLQNGVSENYTYDLVYQLTQVVKGGSVSEGYSYDLVGNRLASLGLSPYQYNSSNQLTSVPGFSYTYDNNGNTTSKADSNGTTTYTWNFENRLASLALPASGGTVTFGYDPFGRRIQKSSLAGSRIYVYDGANMVLELDSGNTVATYAQGAGIDQPLAMSRSGVTAYYQADGLGSVTSLTNGSGTSLATYTYDSFGKKTASTGTLRNPFQYTGREWDHETGLYYYRARYYDPTIGRFISEDSYRFKGGINFYRYAANSPINFNDPLGLEPQGCTDCQGKPKQGTQAGKSCCGNEDPVPASASSPYPDSYLYMSVSANDMYQHGGDGPWGRVVRGCLLCMYRHGVDPSTAHHFCYINGWQRTTNWRTFTGLASAVGEASIYLSGAYTQSTGQPAGSQGTRQSPN